MHHIRQHILRLPHSQAQLVMRELWQLGRDTSPNFANYPALIESRLVIAHTVNGKTAFRPAYPDLRDFAHENIKVPHSRVFQLRSYFTEYLADNGQTGVLAS